MPFGPGMASVECIGSTDQGMLILITRDRLYNRRRDTVYPDGCQLKPR